MKKLQQHQKQETPLRHFHMQWNKLKHQKLQNGCPQLAGSLFTNYSSISVPFNSCTRTIGAGEHVVEKVSRN